MPALQQKLIAPFSLGLSLIVIGAGLLLKVCVTWALVSLGKPRWTDGLNRLFSNRSEVLRAVRDLGLGVVDRLPVLKRMFIREAAGLAGEVPKLLKGEAL